MLALLLGIVYAVVDNIFKTGDSGKLEDIIGSDSPNVEYILICGIDYDEDDPLRDGIGMTDLIMVVCYDRAANTATFLQIPRDTYVGEDVPTGGTGKINAAYSHGKNTENRIANLAKVINEQFGLPIDSYVTIDMRAFREIIDTLGGIEMYVPWDVPVFDANGNQVSTIAQGTHRIDGATAEIIVRSRKGYNQGDIKRLEMQQYFYAAIFRTFMTFPLSDVIRVIPMFSTYVNTDLSVADMIGLASGIQNLESSNIRVIRAPGGATTNINGHTGLYGINAETLAPLLNEYMRPYSDAVSASELGLPKNLAYPTGEVDASVTIMGELPSNEEEAAA